MRKLFLLMALAGVLSACQTTTIDDEINQDNNQSVDDQTPEDYIRLELNTDEGDTEESRTLYTGGGRILWQSGDKVVVNNKTYEVETDGDLAYVQVPAASSYKVFYPAEIRSSAKNMMLQPAQFYAEGSFGKCANPMYGVGTAESGVFLRSVCGVLKLKLTGTATISSIGITDKSGGALSGYFSYTSEVAELQSGSIALPSVVLNCENVGGVKLNSAGVDFYIVMPARTYSSGLKISISDTSGKAMVIDSATPRTIKVNDILSTPTIAYAPASDLLLAEHFDKNVWGWDRYTDAPGFGNPGGTSATGYEFTTSQNSNYGTDAISTTWNTPQTNNLSTSYLQSRGLTDWQMLFQCREVYGALAVGHPTSNRGILRLPKLSGLKAGEVCMATLTFKIAFKNGASSDPLLVDACKTNGPGCVLAYYLDGKKIDTPKNSAYWTYAQNEQPIPLITTGTFHEKLIINHPDNNEIKDNKWHTIRVDFGAVTRETVFMLQSYSSRSAVSEYIIDDIEVRKVAYPYQSDAEHYVISKGTVTNKGKLMLPISSTIGLTSNWMEHIHHLTSLGVEYVDLSIGYDFFYNPTGNNGDTAKWDTALQEAKAKLDAAGLKVWHIHLPGVGIKWTKKDDGTYSTSNDSDPVDFANTTSSIRTAAVTRMTTIIQHVASILKPKYVLIHPSGYNDGGPEDKYYYTSTRKSALVNSLKSLVTVANNAGTTLIIENLGNYQSANNSLTFRPEYINYFTTQASGVKFGFDFSHGTVIPYGYSSPLNTGKTFIENLNAGIMTALHVHGGGNDRDVHLFPGYTGMYSYKDNLEWGETYKAIIDYGYRGPFTYEPSSYAVDCNASWSSLIHNYYNHVYPAYRKKMGN